MSTKLHSRHLRATFLCLIGLLAAQHIVAQDRGNGNFRPSGVSSSASIYDYKPSVVSKVPEFWMISPAQAPSINQFVPWLKQTFEVNSDIDFVLKNFDTDNQGWSVYRYYETYKGIMLDGAMYVASVKNGKVVYMNGQVLDNVTISSAPSISPTAAASNAIQYVQDAYAPGDENNPAPQIILNGAPVLTYNFVSNDINGALKLTFKCNIDGPDIPLNRDIYVDAATGNIVNDLSQLYFGDTSGRGNSYYSGTVNITVNKKNDTTYILADSTQHYCQIWDAKGRTDSRKDTLKKYSQNYTSRRAYFNYAVGDTQKFGVDMMYAAQQWYTYFNTRFGRNGINGANYFLNCYTHFGRKYDNGYWSNTDQHVVMGDGDSTYSQHCTAIRCFNNPYEELDFSAHEITHGFTFFTSGLIYNGESGAINEGFSDIFGETIQGFAQPAQLDWLFAARTGNGIADRNYADPKSYCQPACYMGVSWHRGNADNGYVHYNSTVLSHWYYLLCVGGRGTNDFGHVYQVNRMPMDSAAYIAYNTDRTLTSLAKYNDVRYMSLQIARTRYGMCSAVTQSVLNAWDAVAVYGVNPFITADAARPSMFKGDSVVLTVSGASGASPITFSWAPAASLSSNTVVLPTAKPTVTTTYTVLGVCGSGQTYADSLTIVILPKLFNDSLSRDTICLHDTTIATVALKDTTALGDTIPYVINRIAYHPIVWATNSFNLSGDDVISAAQAFGFTFPFFKDTFTQVYMTTNGYATLTGGGAAVKNGSIPNAAAPNNTLALAWRDMCTTMSIYWGAPRRYVYNTFPNLITYATLTNPSRFVIQVSGETDTLSPAAGGYRGLTGQLVIYKTGDVDMIIMRQDSSSFMTQGIENKDGTKGYVTTGRNRANWSASLDAWRYSPTTSKRLSYNWSVNKYACLPQGGIVTPTKYKTKYSALPCDAPNKYNTIKLVCQVYDSLFKWTKYDTVKVVVVNPQATITGTFHGCKGDTITICTDTGSCRWKWSTGDSTSLCIKIAPDSTTKYTLIGKCWQCADTATQRITINQTLSSSITNDTICSNLLPYVWNGHSYNGAGSFVVSLTSKSGCDSTASLNLEVLPNVTPAISITANPGASIASGTKVTFTATITNGGTAPVYAWKKNNLSVGGNSNTYTDSTLHNGDVITCTLTSNARCASPTTITSNGITITITSTCATIIAPPNPAAIEVCKAGVSTFTINPIAGSPGYQWQYAGSSSAPNNQWTDFGTNSTTATLTGITHAEYVRVVLTLPGCPTSTSPSSTVTVDSTLLAVVVSNVTASSALLSWNAITGATYSISVNGTLYASNTNSLTVTGLRACTTYPVSVTANNSSCAGTPTGSASITTPGAALTLVLTGGTGTSIIATWSAGVGPYKFYYAQQQGSQNFTVVNVSGTTYTIPAKSVTAGNTYVMYVVDEGSTCTPLAQSNYAYYSTPGVCAFTAPVITSATATSTTFTFNWTGVASAYQVYYKKPGSGWVSYTKPGPSYTVTGLAPATCYQYFVVNRCGTAFGWSSPIDSICTLPLCGAPLNLQLSQLTCKGFTATWTAVPGAANYQLFCSVASGSGAPWIASYAKPTNTGLVNIYPKGTTITVYVASNCIGGGRSASSNIQTVTTLTSGCKDDGSIASYTNIANNTGSFGIYPNPNAGTFKVIMNTEATNATATLDVMDVLGRLVYSTDVVNNNGTILETIDMSNTVSSGVYMVRVRCGNDTHIAKVEVQK